MSSLISHSLERPQTKICLYSAPVIYLVQYRWFVIRRIHNPLRAHFIFHLNSPFCLLGDGNPVVHYDPGLAEPRGPSPPNFGRSSPPQIVSPSAIFTILPAFHSIFPTSEVGQPIFPFFLTFQIRSEILSHFLACHHLSPHLWN